jgi:hypothetical protein
MIVHVLHPSMFPTWQRTNGIGAVKKRYLRQWYSTCCPQLIIELPISQYQRPITAWPKEITSSSRAQIESLPRILRSNISKMDYLHIHVWTRYHKRFSALPRSSSTSLIDHAFPLPRRHCGLCFSNICCPHHQLPTPCPARTPSPV